MNLNNKHALVVCSTNTVGDVLIKRFRKENWTVSQTTRTKGLIGNHYYLDLKSDKSILKFAKAINSGVKIDVLVFLCGVLGAQSLIEKSNSEILSEFQINAISQIKIVKCLLNHFSGDGRVIFLNSIAAFNGSFDPVYAASKASIIGFIKSMAKYGPATIRFNAVASGLIEDSKMAEKFTLDDFERHKIETPTGFHNSSKEIAEIIFDICGVNWRNMNGQVIHVNGGRYL